MPEFARQCRYITAWIDGPTIAEPVDMRLSTVAIIASLALAPGCGPLVVLPVAGAGIGVTIGATRPAHRKVNAFVGGAYGAVIGAALEVVVVAVVAASFGTWSLE